MSKVAMCMDCPNEPLISTFAFYKKEFICLRCGSLYEWMQPKAADETPELLTKMKDRETEWEDNVGKFLLTIGAKHTDCELCMTGDDYSHKDHATDEEKEADIKAREWIKQRTERVAA